MKPTKEETIKKALLAKGFRVLNVWFIGLCGWYCDLETGFDESDVVEYYLGYNMEKALENIVTDCLIEF